MPHKPASKALARFTVLDLCRVRSGPTAVRQLADWGANVIKIELPEALDAKEALGGKRHGPDFQNLHRNKRGMTLKLKHPDGIRCSSPQSLMSMWGSRNSFRRQAGAGHALPNPE